MSEELEHLILPAKVLDELFFDPKILKLLIETKQWNKLISVLRNHRQEILDLRQRVQCLETHIDTLYKVAKNE